MTIQKKMKIIFLGTGPALAIPRLGHRDLLCQEARKKGSKSKRTRSSLLLNYLNSEILFDLSPDILEQKKRINFKNLKGIFLTHAHFDACGGFRFFHLLPLKEPIFLFAELKTWQKVLTQIKNQTALNIFKGKIIFQPLRPFQKIKFAHFSIVPFRVEHTQQKDFPTLGFLVNQKLAYASDVSSLPLKTKKLISGIEVLILDSALWFHRRMPFHLNAFQAINLGKELKVKKLYLTQIGHSFPPYKEAQKELQNFVQKQKLKFSVFLAYDGLSFYL